MALYRSQTYMNNNSGYLTNFKSSQYSQQDSTEYSFNRQLSNSSNFKGVTCNLPSSLGINSNVSISIKANNNKNILNLTERHNNKKGFEKQYHQLVQKFRNRGSKFYKAILQLRTQISQKDQKIQDLQQQRKIKNRQTIYSNSFYTRKLLEAQQTINNWVSGACQSSLVYQTEQKSLQYKIIQNIYTKTRQTLNKKNQSSLSTQIESKITFNKSVSIDPLPIGRSSLDLDFTSKLTNSHINSSQLYEQEQTYRSEQVDLVQQTIEFFQNKLQILQTKIGNLSETNQDLLSKIRQNSNQDQHKQQLILNMRRQNIRQTDVINSLLTESQNFQQTLRKIKQQNNLRITQLSNAFVKVNKQNSSLALQQYNSKIFIDQQQNQINQLKRSNQKLSSEAKLQKQQNQFLLPLKQLQNKCNNLEIQLSFLNKQIQLYKIQGAQNEVKIKSLQIQKQQLQLLILNKNDQSKNQELQQENQTLKYKLQIVDSRFVQTSNIKINLEQRIKSLQKQVFDLVQKLNKSQTENQDLKKITQQQIQSRSSTSQQVINISGNQQKSVVKFYQDQMNKLNKTMTELKIVLSDRDNEISYLKRSMQSVNAQLMNTTKTYQQTSTNYQNQQKRLKTQMGLLQNQIKELSMHNSRLSQQWQRHRDNDKHLLQQQVNNLSMQVTVSHVKIKDIELSNRNLRQNIQYAIYQRKQLSQQFDRQQKHNITLQQRIKQFQQMQKSYISECNQYSQVVHELGKAEEELLKKISEIHLLNNKLFKLQADKNDLKKKLTLIQQKQQKLLNENIKLEQLNSQLQTKIILIQNQSSSSYKDMVDKIKDIQSKLQQTVSNQQLVQRRLQQSSLIRNQKCDQQQYLERISQLNQQILDLRQRIQGMTDTQIYINTVTRKDRIIKRLQQQLKQLEHSKDNSDQPTVQRLSQDQKQQLTKQIQSLKQQLEQKTDQYQQLELKNKKIEVLLNVCNKELIDEQIRYGNLQMQSNETISLLTKANQDFQGELEELYEKLQRIQNVLQQYGIEL